MLHDCDTCDETFDSEEERQRHMRELEHFVSSDTSEDRNMATNRPASSSASLSSDSESIQPSVLPGSVPDGEEDDLESPHDELSSLNDSSDEEQGVDIPTSALPKQSSVEFTHQWIATQATTIPTLKEKKKHNKMKQKGTQSRVIKCETCDRKFPNLEAVNEHMESKNHFNPPKQFECNSCTKKFSTEEAVIEHLNEKKHWDPSMPANPKKMFAKIAAKRKPSGFTYYIG